jgi:homoserine kinase type II
MTQYGSLDAALLDRAAAEVRSQFSSVFASAPLVPLGNGGGFSGARLWRLEAPAGRACLRAWPPGETRPRLLHRHHLMIRARRAGLGFVPAVFATSEGITVVATAERLWDLTEWFEGRADYSQHPTTARLEAACEALGRLHRVWELPAEPPATCLAVRRRLEFLRDWQALLRSGWRPAPAVGDPLRLLAERAWQVLRHRIHHVPSLLAAWVDKTWPVQPCLCDVWHDHLLFEGERLSGLVDYGAVKVDHVAVDLARMLGSLVCDDADSWAVGLGAYRRVRRLSPDGAELARILDRTGVVVGAANWLCWLYWENRHFEDLAPVRRHLEGLVDRIESWTD